MKSNKKFPPELRAIIDQGLKDKSAWIGKTVQELTCEAIKKRGINQEDVEGCVVLTVKEAKEFEAMIYDFLETFESQFDIPEWNHYVNLHQLLEKRIKQTEGE